MPAGAIRANVTIDLDALIRQGTARFVSCPALKNVFMTAAAFLAVSGCGTTTLDMTPTPKRPRRKPHSSQQIRTRSRLLTLPRSPAPTQL